MQLIDPTHTFYRPLWVRLSIVGVCAGWTVFEAVKGDPFFMVIVGALAIYSARVLLFAYKPVADIPVETAADTTDPVAKPDGETPPENSTKIQAD